jgi:hypothetical protein
MLSALAILAKMTLKQLKVLQRSEANDELRAHTLAFLAQCFLKMGDRKQAVTCLRGLHVLRPELAEELAESLGLLNG